MPLQAVIFDMDGVIIQSEEYWFGARVDFAVRLGKPWTAEDQRHCMGVNTLEWAQVMQERLGIDMPLEEIAREVTDGVVARIDDHLPLLPGAVEAAHIAASRYPTALASGAATPVIVRVMERTGLNKVFKTMVQGDDIPRGKPNPDIYLEAARRLGVDPTRCVGIEDSPNGLRALKAAGMIAIAVPSPGYPLPPELVQMADCNLVSLTEFSLELLESLGK